jgi:hypothetical protein
MTINIRRVVTGHDTNGKAVVNIDDVGAHVVVGRPNMSRQLIWTTNDLPVHFVEDGEDKGARDIGTTIKNGSVFRVIEFCVDQLGWGYRRRLRTPYTSTRLAAEPLATSRSATRARTRGISSRPYSTASGSGS